MGGAEGFFGGLFGRFGGDPEQKKAKFESNLFKDGVFSFSEDSVRAEAKKWISSRTEWYRDPNAANDMDLSASLLFHERNEHGTELLWQRRFSNCLPAPWLNAEEITNTLQDAREGGITLSKTLIDAAATHPDQIVARVVGTTQRLTIQQLAWVLTHPALITELDGSESEYSEIYKILAAQKKFGMTALELKQAQDIAKKLHGEFYGEHVQEEISVSKEGIKIERSEKTEEELTLHGVVHVGGGASAKEHIFLWDVHEYYKPGLNVDVRFYLTSVDPESKIFLAKNEAKLKLLLIKHLSGLDKKE